MIKSEKLTQKRLKELLHYDPKTGIFTWKVNKSSSARKGNIAGCFDNGYLKTMIEGKFYLNHRLAWLYVHGYFPENQIDHKDRIKQHNWIDNLREVSNQCNSRNCGNRKNNTSGVKGVYWYKSANKWAVHIKINKKTKYLGRFTNFDNAVCARLAVEQCLGWEDCDSNSPAFQYVQKMLKLTKKKLPRIIVK